MRSAPHEFAEPTKGLAGATDVAPGVDLYWIPLGAGHRSVRLNGKVFEATLALLQRRPRSDLYHAALEVYAPDGRYVIEMTPVPDERGAARGVVGEGAVGSRWVGRIRRCRYENRRWRDGAIPDLHEANEGPARITSDPRCACRILDLVPQVPTPVWGRDEMGAGEMWTSNSVISWVLASAEIDAERLAPPANGRAPGWSAGIAVARRDLTTTVHRSAPTVKA